MGLAAVIAVLVLVGRAALAAAQNGNPQWIATGIVTGVLVFCVALSAQETDSMAKLRALEAAVFFSLAGFITFVGYRGMLAGSASFASVAFQGTVVIFAYGVLVPNPFGRAALMTLLLAALPMLAIVGILVREGSSASTGDLAGPMTLLGVASLLSMASAGLVTAFRRVAVETRTNNMYGLLEQIGEGAMGEVWRAEHKRLARPAAIKIVRPELLDGDPKVAEEIAQRFVAEARSTANLRSPNTVEIYDVGTTDDGTFYYVMELLDGLDLESMVERYGPLPPARCVHVLKQVCLSLADAHESGLVHRDIKPANIHVGRLGQNFDIVKVLDFGLATPTSDDEVESRLSGTPAYLAPEQVEKGGTSDPRADIYALGCVAYFALTGKLVFGELDLVKTALAHAQQTPLPPSVHDSSIGDSIDELVLRCLVKKPEERVQSAAELLAALEDLELPAWTRHDAEAWWRKVALDRETDTEVADQAEG